MPTRLRRTPNYVKLANVFLMYVGLFVEK